MKKLAKVVVILFVGFLVLQLFQVDKTNAPINAADTLEATVAVPAGVAEILGRSCNDCHSNKTVYPWYSYVQPAGWFLRDHVDHGKEHLNFSVFKTYSVEKQGKKFDEICEQVEASAMPLPSYL